MAKGRSVSHSLLSSEKTAGETHLGGRNGPLADGETATLGPWDKNGSTPPLNPWPPTTSVTWP